MKSPAFTLRKTVSLFCLAATLLSVGCGDIDDNDPTEEASQVTASTPSREGNLLPLQEVHPLPLQLSATLDEEPDYPQLIEAPERPVEGYRACVTPDEFNLQTLSEASADADIQGQIAHQLTLYCQNPDGAIDSIQVDNVGYVDTSVALCNPDGTVGESVEYRMHSMLVAVTATCGEAKLEWTYEMEVMAKLPVGEVGDAPDMPHSRPNLMDLGYVSHPGGR